MENNFIFASLFQRNIEKSRRKLISRVNRAFEKYTKDHLRGGKMRKLTASEIARKYGI